MCPNRCALYAAIWAEIATSPASPFAASRTAGKDSTSVGLFFPRKHRFRRRSSPLLVTRTFTSPRSLAARCARDTNRANTAWLNPGIRTLISTTLFSLKNEQEGKKCTLLLIARSYSGDRSSSDGTVAFSGRGSSGTVGLPFAPFLVSSSDICCSATLTLCSS